MILCTSRGNSKGCPNLIYRYNLYYLMISELFCKILLLLHLLMVGLTKMQLVKCWLVIELNKRILRNLVSYDSCV